MEFAGQIFGTREMLTAYFVKSFYQENCDAFIDEAINKIMEGFDGEDDDEYVEYLGSAEVTTILEKLAEENF
jgi:hypothetical protein